MIIGRPGAANEKISDSYDGHRHRRCAGALASPFWWFKNFGGQPISTDRFESPYQKPSTAVSTRDQ